MISRFLSIAALSLLVVGGPSVACAAEAGRYVAHECILQSMGECVRQVQSMLAKRGYLIDYPEGEWEECSSLAADAFLSDKGKLEEMSIPELADELERTPANVRRNGEPVCLPVYVGGLEGLDDCSLGVVTGLNPQGDNFLAVRSGPGTDFVKIDELREGERVWVCDGRGQWVGIAYTRGGDVACGNTSHAERTAYTGPCRSGWVSKSYITIIAG